MPDPGLLNSQKGWKKNGIQILGSRFELLQFVRLVYCKCSAVNFSVCVGNPQYIHTGTQAADIH